MELDWNDLRYLLEIERTGTVRAAAKRLQVNHATISRHLATVQERLGVRLLQREGRRLVFTDAGQELLATARDVEHRILDAERKLSGRDLGAQGTVRVTMPEAIVHVLAGQLRDFEAHYPEITIDLVTGLTFSNLARMEADIAVRIASSPPSTLVGRRIAPVAIYAYGTASLLDAVEPCSINGYPWIGWADSFRHFPMEAWLRKHVAPHAIRLTVNTTATLIALVLNGSGVGFLPSFLARREPALRKLANDSTPIFHNQVWVLMHEDVRVVPRVRAVSQWLARRCQQLLIDDAAPSPHS